MSRGTQQGHGRAAGGLTSVGYVVPVHNDEGRIRAVSARILERLETYENAELILVENGSVDASYEECLAMAGEWQGNTRVKVLRSEKGLGNALREGVGAAEAEILVLTASDLPFGFSDLDAYEEVLSRGGERPAVALGSKAHPASQVERSLARQLMSFVFRILRRVSLGMTYGDTQGTLILDRAVAGPVVAACENGGYLLTTELVARLHRIGLSVVEVPVTSEPTLRGSTVRPLADGWAMAVGTWKLREILKQEGEPQPHQISKQKEEAA